MNKLKKIIFMWTNLGLILILISGGLLAGIFAMMSSSGSGSGIVNSDSLKNLNEEQRAFINSILNGTMKTFTQYKVFPSVTIAQAILESGWGKSDLAIEGRNLFGIKADSSWKGQTVLMSTNEEYGGHAVTEMAAWRKYNSFDDSVEDHGKFLAENSRYSSAGVFEAKNYKEQITAIKNAGYATESNYVELICGVIENYGLNSLDGTTQNGNNGTIENAILIGQRLIGNSTYDYGSGRNDYDIARKHFDCSSFIHYIFTCSGVQLGDRGSVSTESLITIGTSIDKGNLQRGDLIFFNTVGINSHVGIYLGNGKFMHCSTSKGVTISEFSGYYESVFYAARRVV